MEEKKTTASPNLIGGTAPNGQVAKNDPEIPGTPAKPVVLRQKSISTVQGEPQIPKRLSQLFHPPGEELYEKEDDTTESSRLLGSVVRRGSLQPVSAAKEAEKTGERQRKKTNSEGDDVSLSILDKIEDVKVDSDFGSDDAHASSSESSDEIDDVYTDREADYISWDDTICSNRSAYFKHYYQKNLSPLGPGRQSDGATSHTSLVSLIKEKNKMAEKSSESRKKKKEDMGLMVLVVVLFLVLVVGISLIYHFYNLHLEELSLFKRLKFNEEGRILNLLDSEGHMDIQARLGTTLSLYSKPEDCTHYLQYFYNYRNAGDELISPEALIRTNKSATDFVIKRKRRQNEFQFDDETVCLDWSNQARVQIHRAQSRDHVSCYNVFWSTQDLGMTLRDCMLISSPEYGVWWGIGEVKGGGYPLEAIPKLPSFLFTTGELSKYPFGRLLRRTFLSSFGGLLILPDHLPASLSVSPEELCVSVNHTGLPNPPTPLTLNYTICSSPNVSSTIDYLHSLARGGKYYPPLNPKFREIVKERILLRIEYPVWVPYNQPNQPQLTQESVLAYVDSLNRGNQTEWGHILLPLSWQKRTGDLDFDPDRFPDPKSMVEALMRKGFRLALTISPVVSTDTEAFRNGTTEGFWVQQLESSLPALIEHHGVLAGALTDFTNPRASAWFVTQMKQLEVNYGVNRFHLDPPDAHSIPKYHEFNQVISNADLALQPFLKAISTVSPPLSIESAISPPPLPTFVSVGSEDSGWKSLSSLVPRILTLSMLGYPLIDAGMVGGTPTRAGNVPEAKLYIRWMQTVSFLPAFQMNVLPEMYDENTQAIVTDCLQKRKTLVLPRLQKAVEGALVNNTPLISPLGLLNPDDIVAASVGDEWVVGDDLLIAPILDKDTTSRNIYIPSGLWESQLDGRLKRGPGWIKDYKVPLSDVALFIKRYTM